MNNNSDHGSSNSIQDSSAKLPFIPPKPQFFPTNSLSPNQIISKNLEAKFSLKSLYRTVMRRLVIDHKDAVIFLILIFSLAQLLPLRVSGHIRLTYPQARSYPFDFLDNVRTWGPCGVPTSSGPITNIIPGTTFDVTWHLGYPHRGGYRIELINSKNQVILVLAPTEPNVTYAQTPDSTVQSQRVTIPPNLICEDCFIRLLRQANEWTAGPEGYLFWSCADVKIKPGLDPCKPNGQQIKGKCECGKKFYGTFCQEYNECDNDEDCSNQGKCIDTQSTTFPQKVCYCKWGFIGSDCSRVSSIKTWDFDPRFYNTRQLSSQPGNEYTMYWRLFPENNEIEIVLQANTTNWLGIGWRPNNLRSKCQHFPLNLQYGGVPLYPNSALTIPNRIPVQEGGAVSEPKSARASAPVNEPRSEPKAEGSIVKPVAEGQAEPLAPKNKPVPESEAKAVPEPESASTVGAKANNPRAESSVPPIPEGESRSRPKRQALNTTFEAQNLDYLLVTNGSPSPPSPATTVKPVPSDAETDLPVIGNKKVLKIATFLYSTPAHSLSPNSEMPNAPTSETRIADRPKPQAGGTPPSTSNPAVALPESVVPRAEVEPEVAVSDTSTTAGDIAPILAKAENPAAESEISAGNVPAASLISNAEPGNTNFNLAERVVSLAEPGAAKAEVPSATVPNSKVEPIVSHRPEPSAESGGVPSASSPPPIPVSEEDLNDISTKGNAIHPMDCLDVVIGHVRDSFIRIDDYYSRDRSTPILDTVLGGRNDISGAMGYEKNGVTTILFRKKLKSSDLADHSFIEAPMHVSWAKGQNIKAPFHRPFSGIETGSAKDRTFYHDGEFKYHGTRQDQRGSEVVSFYDKVPNRGTPLVPTATNPGVAINQTLPLCHISEWKYPPNCQHNECLYVASWSLNSAAEEISFTITAKNSMNKWTGIGFSKGRKMPNSDLVYGWITADGKVVMFDAWSEKYGQPVKDTMQDIYDVEGSFINLTTTLKFKRKRNTGDTKQDVQFSDVECNYLFFPYAGAEWHEDGTISRHESSPIVTEGLICIRPCSAHQTPSNSTMLGENSFGTNRTGSAFNVNFKLDQDWSDKLDDPQSLEYQLLANDLRTQIRNVLSEIPQFQDVHISGFKRGSVIVQSKVAVVNDKPETIAMMKAILMMASIDGKVGSYKIIPKTIDVSENGCYAWGKFYAENEELTIQNGCSTKCVCTKQNMTCNESTCNILDNSLNLQDSRIQNNAIPIRLSIYNTIAMSLIVLYNII